MRYQNRDFFLAVALACVVAAACAAFEHPHDSYLDAQRACIAEAGTPEVARACICKIKSCDGGSE